MKSRFVVVSQSKTSVVDTYDYMRHVITYQLPFVGVILLKIWVVILSALGMVSKLISLAFLCSL